MAKPHVLMGPFAAVAAGALVLIAIQWFRKGPGTIGEAAIPPVFVESPRTVVAAMEKAAPQHRMVVAFATASWCGPCQEFKRSTLSDPRVAEAIIQAGVPAYIDVDKDADGAGRLKVFSIPVMIALKDGKEVGRMEGNRSASDVISWLGSLPAK